MVLHAGVILFQVNSSCTFSPTTMIIPAFIHSSNEPPSFNNEENLVEVLRERLRRQEDQLHMIHQKLIMKSQSEQSVLGLSLWYLFVALTILCLGWICSRRQVLTTLKAVLQRSRQKNKA
jgi:hypothetical protein